MNIVQNLSFLRQIVFVIRGLEKKDMDERLDVAAHPRAQNRIDMLTQI